jgi:hypothetical protein
LLHVIVIHHETAQSDQLKSANQFIDSRIVFFDIFLLAQIQALYHKTISASTNVVTSVVQLISTVGVSKVGADVAQLLVHTLLAAHNVTSVSFQLQLL